MNVLELSKAYADMSSSELEAALASARETQCKAADADNEFVFLQQDTVIQAILLAQQKQEGGR